LNLRLYVFYRQIFPQRERERECERETEIENFKGTKESQVIAFRFSVFYLYPLCVIYRSVRRTSKTKRERERSYGSRDKEKR
jgi:hypothetical protein